MNILTITAIILIISGSLGLAFSGFNYTKPTANLDIVAQDISNERQQMYMPVSAGMGLIIIGALLVLRRKR